MERRHVLLPAVAAWLELTVAGDVKVSSSALQSAWMLAMAACP